jgi:hypothetical protein
LEASLANLILRLLASVGKIFGESLVIGLADNLGAILGNLGGRPRRFYFKVNLLRIISWLLTKTFLSNCCCVLFFFSPSVKFTDLDVGVHTRRAFTQRLGSRLFLYSWLRDWSSLRSLLGSCLECLSLGHQIRSCSFQVFLGCLADC